VSGESLTSSTLSEDDASALVGERVRLLAERSRDAVAGVLTGSTLIAFVLQRHAPWQAVAIWVLMFFLVNAYRVLLSRRLLKSEVPQTTATLYQYFAFAVANGLWLAALSFGFFSLLPLESRLALTVLILLAVAGGVATYASYAPGYIAFVALAIPPLTFEWARVDGESAWVIVTTLLIFGFTMVAFSRYLVSVFERSVLIRFDRESVVVELRAEQQQSERERKKAEDASLAKSRFLANASHDLRQPAQALALYTAVLQRSAETESQVELAFRISQASAALGGLLNNLLDLSRLDAGAVRTNFERVDLQRLISRLATESAHFGTESDVSVTSACPPVQIRTDPVILERMLRNLLHNAMKFTASGTVEIRAAVGQTESKFTVTDTGCGIAPEFHERIFDEFFQVDNAERDRERGLGLGLSIVFRLASLLGGRVELTSHVGAGSAFTVTLPGGSLPPEVGRVVAPVKTSTVDFSGVSVLVIDDDLMVRESLNHVLLAWGANVDAVGTISEAMALADQRVWRLCLCDLRLPGAEDGLQGAVILRARCPDMPIVFISGDTAPERIESATLSGHSLLHKPVNAALLSEKMAELLQSEPKQS
jgi:two-component system, sensor histidine kinase